MGQSFARFRTSRKVAMASLSMTLAAASFLLVPVANAATTSAAGPTATVKVVGLSTKEGAVSSVGNKYSGNASVSLELNSAAGPVYVSLGAPVNLSSVPTPAKYNGAAQLGVVAFGNSSVTRSKLNGPIAVTVRSNSTRWALEAGSNSVSSTRTALGQADVNLAASAAKPVTGSIAVVISPKGKAATTVTYNYTIKAVAGNKVQLTLSGKNNSASKTFAIGQTL